MPERKDPGNSYKKEMTRKVFKTHYIELIGCSSRTFLLRHSKHLVHPGELKLHNTPEKSYGSKSWAVSGRRGKHIAKQRNESLAHRGQQPSSAVATQGKTHFSHLLFLSEPQLACSAGQETTQGLLRAELPHGWVLQALCGVGKGQVLVWAKGPQGWRAQTRTRALQLISSQAQDYTVAHAK